MIIRALEQQIDMEIINLLLIHTYFEVFNYAINIGKFRKS